MKHKLCFLFLVSILISGCSSNQKQLSKAEALYDEYYSIGYDSGREKGYEEGYEEGYNDGYDSGIEDMASFYPDYDDTEDESTIIVEESYDTLYTTANIHLRSGPGTEYASLTLIPEGEDLSIKNDSDGIWKEVDYNGKHGYVSSDYLSTEYHPSSLVKDFLSQSDSSENTNEPQDHEIYSDNYTKSETMVWLSETGSKYHRQSNCGNMNPDTAYQIPLSDAIDQGYDACSRCY